MEVKFVYRGDFHMIYTVKLKDGLMSLQYVYREKSDMKPTHISLFGIKDFINEGEQLLLGW